MRHHGGTSIATFLAVLACACTAGCMSAAAAAEPMLAYEMDGKTVSNPYVMDTEIHEYPDTPRPAKGKAYIDPIFHTRITRVTDRVLDGYEAHKIRFMKPVYTKNDCENCDGSRIILSCANWDWGIYDTATWKLVRYSRRREAGAGRLRSGQIEPRWDARKPNILYYRHEAALWRYDVETDKATLVHDFAKDLGIAKAYVAGEGSPSFDCRYWALMTDMRAKVGSFVYDMEADKILGTRPGRGNWVSMSPSGERFVAASSSPATRGRPSDVNPTSYDRTLKNPVTLCTIGNHGDTAIDAEGNEVYVHQCANRKTNSVDWYTMHDLKTGKATKLIHMIHKTTWPNLTRNRSGIHFTGTCYATPGWVLVTMDGTGTKPACWQHQMIYLLELKANPRIIRLAYSRAAPAPKVHGDHGGAAYALINRRGTRVYWGSNWNDPGSTIETYMLELPPNWYEDIMGKETATRLRRKAAALLGITVEQLVGDVEK